MTYFVQKIPLSVFKLLGISYFLFIWFEISGYQIPVRNSVLNSIDGITHQSHGELYCKKIKESNKFEKVYSNRLDNISFGMRFPDKYPLVPHYLNCKIGKFLGTSFIQSFWISIFSVYILIFLCVFFILKKMTPGGPYFSIQVGSTYLIFVFAIMSGGKFNLSGITLASSFEVGLFSQTYAFAFFLTGVACSLLKTKSIFRVLISSLLFFLALLSNITTVPLLLLYLTVLILIYGKEKKGFLLISPILISAVAFLPYFFNFTARSYFSSSMAMDQGFEYLFPNYAFLLPLMTMGLIYYNRREVSIIDFIPLYFTVGLIFWEFMLPFFYQTPALHFLTALPVQPHRYAFYLFITWLVIYHLNISRIVKKLEIKKVLILLFTSLLLAIAVYLKPFTRNLTLNQKIVDELEVSAQGLKGKLNPRETILVAIGMEGGGLRFTERSWYQVSDVLRLKLISKGVRVAYTGYRENNLYQFFLQPLLQVLTAKDNLGVLPISLNFMQELKKKSTKQLIELLRWNHIRYLACPKDDRTMGLCSRSDFLKNTKKLFEDRYFDYFDLMISEKTNKERLIIIANPGLKPRLGNEKKFLSSIIEDLILKDQLTHKEILYLPVQVDRDLLNCLINKGKQAELLNRKQLYDYTLDEINNYYRKNKKILVMTNGFLTTELSCL